MAKHFAIAALKVCIFVSVCAPVWARAQEGCASAPGDQAAKGRVKTVSERLELALQDGRLLGIAGIDPPRPTPDNPDIDVESSRKLAGALIGKDIAFRIIGARPDRWGRFVAEVFAPEGDAGAPPRLLAQTALEAGLARFEPGAAAHACRTALLAAEERARAAALGLWADPYYAVIAVGDHDAFAERSATSVIVEGRVIGVDRGAYRTTLLFGQRRGWDFSVTVLQRHSKTFSAAGLDLESLKGRTIRVRGLLDTRFGPEVEISDPDEIELLAERTDEARPQPASQR